WVGRGRGGCSAKRWQQRILPWLSKSFALPSDAVLEIHRITIIGQLHVYIENNQGIVVFIDSELKLKSTKGYIEITGKSFVLNIILPDEILLEGTINEL